ncbi:hypothetical protein [Eubacterium ventriosum]|uniref:hypothetical protein n=1 Tax=Eubacterium ventriosum TaxID=39496 RepID=UPI0035225A42
MAFIILTFSIISFISMGISQQMYGQKLQLALKEYGGFSQALIQIKDSEYNKLKKNNLKLGSFYCENVFLFENKKYTVGYVDNDFEKMANINVHLIENARIGSLFARISVVSVLVMSCILVSGFIPINEAKETESFMPIPSVDVIQLTDREQKDFMKKYNVKKDDVVVFNGSGIDLSSILNDQVTLGKVTINQKKYSFNKQSIHISKIVNQGYNNSNISGEGLITIVVPKSNTSIKSIISGYDDIFIEAKNNIDIFNLKDSRVSEALKKLDREVLIILYNLIIVIIISIISRLVIVRSLNKMKVRDWLRGNV